MIHALSFRGDDTLIVPSIQERIIGFNRLNVKISFEEAGFWVTLDCHVDYRSPPIPIE